MNVFFIIGNTAITPGLEQGTILDGAVSYTHIRAHETVLDLVCRLLLEKKNKQIPPQITYLPGTEEHSKLQIAEHHTE